MRYAHYNNETKDFLGWYHSLTHKVIPKPCIEVSENDFKNFLGKDLIISNNKVIEKPLTENELNELSNIEIKRKLDELDLKSIRSLLEGDTARIEANKLKVVELRKELK